MNCTERAKQETTSPEKRRMPCVCALALSLASTL